MRTENTNFDKLFIIAEGKSKFEGRFQKATELVTKIQLKDPEKWALFVSQFKNGVDGIVDGRGWRGEYWGKMMRGASMIYRYTQDKELYNILEETVYDMMSAQDEDGRISSYDREHEFRAWDIWCRKYVFLGMQYFYDICEDEKLKEKITKTLCGHLDYIMKYIGPESEGKMPITKASADWHGLNSSSLLEPVMRLYNITKDEKHLNFAKHIVNEGGAEGFNVFEHALKMDMLPHQYQDQKAYEMTSCFEGLLEYYRVTGDENCLKSVVNYSKMLVETEVTVLGSLGTVHELLSNATAEQTNPDNTGIMQETCVTVTWMKFCLQLLRITGESVYADEIERAMFNDMLGSINTEGTQNGHGFPFDSYTPLMPGPRGRGTGGLQRFRKEGESGAYGCCACIGSAGVAVPMLSAVMESERGINLNFYMQGKAETSFGKLEISTNYPIDGEVNVIVDSDKEFDLKLRIPYFSKINELEINGNKVNAEIIPGTYFTLSKKWNKGDKIRLLLDLRGQVINAPENGSHPYSKYHYAIRRGPVVLARDLRLGGSSLDEVYTPNCDENGYIELIPSNNASFNRNEEYLVPMKNGELVAMVDSASAGSTWDKNSFMSVWQPNKKYWDTDLSKDVVLWFTGDQHWKYENNRFMTVDENGKIIVSANRNMLKEEPHKFRFIFINEDTARIQDTASKMFLTVDGDGLILKESIDADVQLFKIWHDYKDKYYIHSVSKKERLMRRWNKDAYCFCEEIYEDMSAWLIRNE